MPRKSASTPAPARGRAKPAAGGPVSLSAFGQTVALAAPPDRFLREDSAARLRDIYAPALSGRSLAAEGVAIDVGAGFGGFAIPFALAHPGWTVWCFEPDADAFAALTANIAALGLANVIALPLAVGDTGTAGGDIDMMRVAELLDAGDAAAVVALCPRQLYRRHREHRGLIEAAAPLDARFEPCELPTLPARALLQLGPQLLKLAAPGAEAAILAALEAAALDHVLGETGSRLAAPVALSAFGQTLRLLAPADGFLREDTTWRLREVYEPALTARTLAPEGVAVDIGAGFGGFALPFALAYPGWTVWCFEPEAEAFAALNANIAALGLANVVALPMAVGDSGTGGADIDLARLAALVAAGDVAAAAALCPQRPHRRHRRLRSVIEAGAPESEQFEPCPLPTVPARALLQLAPQLLKLTAPHAERAILEALVPAPLDHLLGEMWTTPPAALVHGPAAGLRQTWLPVAGVPMLKLRRTADPMARRPGLDVVVAMYNAVPWIEACIDGILASPSHEVRALVVDDGSTDGSGDLVRDLYAGDRRVQLLPKPNGGCASARNFGRMHSDASHIAFVDADDVPGPHLYSELLDLARYTGAEVVQGGFEMLHTGPDGSLRREPSYESAQPGFRDAQRRPFGRGHCFMLPAHLLIAGQPTIWRRVYRRDFLDNRKIWFPEHIRAFDDQIFQLLTLQYARSVPMLDHVRYGYRQHPGQDIRQGDERGFYSLEMFRLMLKRALTEGWNDLPPLLTSFVNTVNWTHAGLRPDLKPIFAQAALELWLVMQKALGAPAFRDLPDSLLQLPDRDYHLAQLRPRLADIGDSYAWAYLDSAEMHVQIVKARRNAPVT
jgi:FkbM family methyltransferase